MSCDHVIGAVVLDETEDVYLLRLSKREEAKKSLSVWESVYKMTAEELLNDRYSMFNFCPDCGEKLP